MVDLFEKNKFKVSMLSRLKIDNENKMQRGFCKQLKDVILETVKNDQYIKKGM